MVCDVARDDVGDRPHGDGIVARDSRPIPRLLWQALEEGDRRETYVFELLNEVSPRSVIRMGVLDGDVLIEARQRVCKAARKPEPTGREYPLTVVHVVQNLANCPLSRRVRVKALLLADSAQKLEHLAHLVLHRGHDVVAGYQVDVHEIVVGCFGCLWSCHLAENPNKNR